MNVDEALSHPFFDNMYKSEEGKTNNTSVIRQFSFEELSNDLSVV